MMVGSEDYMGSFEVELGSRIQDTIDRPISEAYIQHWFQEEFLQLFYEDTEFREQVLKCLLAGDGDEGTVQVRKPRRTWFNGLDLGEIPVEASCEEARYLYHCRDKPTASDLSTDAGNKIIVDTSDACIAACEQPEKPIHTNEVQINESLKTVQTGSYESETKLAVGQGKVDASHPSVLLEGQLDIRFVSPGLQPLCVSNIKNGAETRSTVTPGPDSPESPLSLAVASQAQPSNLERPMTAPCVHGRGTQTWKANPLYKCSNVNSDSDSNDSWQKEYANISWMDDLENGKMLEEVKIRKMKRLVHSWPSVKVVGYKRWRESLKKNHQVRLPAQSQGPPLAFTKGSDLANLQKNTILNDEQTRKPKFVSISDSGTALPSNVSNVVPTQDVCEEATVRASLETMCRENMMAKRPIVSLYTKGFPCFSIHGDEVQKKSSSASISTETVRLDEELIFDCRHGIVNVTPPVSFVFIEENDIANRSLSQTSLETPTSWLIQELRPPMEGTSPAPTVVIRLSECEKAKPPISDTYLETVRLEAETIAPIASARAPLHAERQEKGTINQALPRTFQARKLSRMDKNPDCEPLTESISLASPSVVNDIEENPPSAGILGSTRSLDEELSISQESSPSKWPAKRTWTEATKARIYKPSWNHEEIKHANVHQEMRFDEKERPTLENYSQTLPCGSIIEKGKTKSLDLCGPDVLFDKGISNPSGNISGESSLVAAKAEEEVGKQKSPLRDGPRGVTRAVFTPVQNIHWLPPKRNIQFRNKQTARRPADHWLKKNKETCDNAKWNVRWDRLQTTEANEEAASNLEPEQETTEFSSRSHGSRIHLWASLLRKLFKRTIAIGQELP